MKNEQPGGREGNIPDDLAAPAQRALAGAGIRSLEQLARMREADVKQLLAIPNGVALAAHIGVGFRDEPWPRTLARRPLEEFAFSERYGDPLAAG